MNIDNEIKRSVDSALAEDRAGSDVTSRLLLAKDLKVTAEIHAKSKGVLCGSGVAALVFKKRAPGCRIRFHAEDGARLVPGKKIMTVTGKARDLLSAERTALNFLQHLSGVATLSSSYVDAVKGTSAKILDTRKTVPGLRALEKYAVRCGGAQNHRMNLSAMAMVKDNHLRAARYDWAKIARLKSSLPKGTLLAVEAETLDDVKQSLWCGADIVMLDNMTPARIKESVKLIRSVLKSVLIEVTGGVTLKNVRSVAKLGVDRISVGALTHSAPALDIGMELASK